MKKIVLLLLCITAFGSFAAVHAETGPTFDFMRTVIIANTTQQGTVSSYMTDRLKQPFRIPYYQQREINDVLTPDNINTTTLRNLAQMYQADIILVPLVRTWQWEEYHAPLYDEMITEYNYRLTVYAYDRKNNAFNTYSVSGFDRGESSVLNQPQAVLQEAMDRLMEELPYKRIPTDIDITPPTNIPETTTTDGNAKILTHTDFPAAI